MCVYMNFPSNDDDDDYGEIITTTTIQVELDNK